MLSPSITATSCLLALGILLLRQHYSVMDRGSSLLVSMDLGTIPLPALVPVRASVYRTDSHPITSNRSQTHPGPVGAGIM